MSTPAEPPADGPAVVVTVRGRFEAKHPPERATLTLAVGHEGADKGEVHARTVASANAVAAAIRALVDPERGPATWWAGDRIRSSAHRPWNKDGKQLPLVFRSVVQLRVKFRDFEALARFVDDVAVRPGVAVDGIEWALTEARRIEADREARRRAVADAVQRAGDYADAAGLGPVVPVAIADAGMLGDRSAPAGHEGAAAFVRATPVSAGGGGGEESLDLSPEDITVAATIDARFVARSQAR